MLFELLEPIFELVFDEASSRRVFADLCYADGAAHESSIWAAFHTAFWAA